ncbi:MAG: protein translocase SEC61 complex subunit gamma [Candidatus Aenigmatarchaeota archaeon]
MDIRSFFKSCERVLKVATKPSKEEFFKTFKVTGLGILLIGAIGFAIFLIFQFGGMLV